MIRLKAVGGVLSLFALVITVIPVFILDLIWGAAKGVAGIFLEKNNHWNLLWCDFADGCKQFWKQLKTGKYQQ